MVCTFPSLPTGTVASTSMVLVTSVGAEAQPLKITIPQQPVWTTPVGLIARKALSQEEPALK